MRRSSLRTILWYNGYSWLGEERVYNPFDVLLLFAKREFGAWWFQTGTPDFLLRTLVQRGLSSVALNDMVASGQLLDAFDVEHIATEALLFQTGYLTILGRESRHGNIFYRLGYPNREVRQSLNDSLLEYLTRGASGSMTENRLRLLDVLGANDFPAAEGPVPSLLREHPAPVAHATTTSRATRATTRAWFYSCFAGRRSSTSRSRTAPATRRLDMAVCFNRNVYLFELKVVERDRGRRGDGTAPGTALRRQVPGAG